MDTQLSANINNPALSPSLQNMLATDVINSPGTFFQKAIPTLITLGFIIGAIVFVFWFIIGAIQWITAGSDKAALEGARSRIVNALIGIAILLSAFAIIKVVEIFFGTNLLLFNLGDIKIQ
jgi:hypothetical protein